MNLKFFQRKTSFRKKGLHTNPDVFWNILQGLALLILLASLALGFSLFQEIDEALLASSAENISRPEMITKDKINEALEYFAELEKKSISILGAPAPVVDPSK